MASLPPVKRFVLEDYSNTTTIPEFASRLFYPLNLFLNAVYAALNNGLTLAQNTVSVVKTVSNISPNSSGIASTTINWPFTQSPPALVAVGSCLQGLVAMPPPSISWSYSAGVVSITMQFLQMVTTNQFIVTSANASSGAVYSNNNLPSSIITFTVVETIAGATSLLATGSGVADNSKPLLKVSGTGDSSITFSNQNVTSVASVAASGGKFNLNFWVSAG